MFTRLFCQSAGAWNVLRYQPVPPGKNPSPDPVGLSLSGLLSMLQSWGRSTARQETSENDDASAPLGSPRKNFHPASAANSCRAGFALAAPIETGRKHAIVAARRIWALNRIFMRASFRCCLWGWILLLRYCRMTGKTEGKACKQAITLTDLGKRGF